MTISARPLLALFVRAVREDTRAKGTYLMRVGLVTLILVFLRITHMETRWVGGPGLYFFASVLWIDLFTVSVAGLNYFASTISEEKEDGTLGLIRMTELNALSILLGKSTGRMLGALLLLIAQIPFALVAVTMGGIAVHQVLAGYVCLLGFTFFAANLGLLCSVVCRRSGAASGWAGGVASVYLFGPILLQIAQRHPPQWLLWTISEPGHAFIQAWYAATPISRVLELLRTGFDGPAFSSQSGLDLLLGGGCFVAAWLLFEPCARRAVDATDVAGFGRARLRRSRRPPGLGLAAVRWKEFYTIGGPKAVGFKLIASILFTGWAWWMTATIAKTDSAFRVFSLISGSVVILLLFLTRDADCLFRLERQQRTLVTLCGLPFSGFQLVIAKVIGSLSTNWPVLIPVGLGMFVFLADSRSNIRLSASDVPYLIGFLAHATFCFIMLPVFVAWLSLRIRRGAAALAFTIWFIGNWLAALIVGVLFERATLLVLPMISLSVVCWLSWGIPRRFEQSACEE